jgi:hypothetical protein
MFTLSSELAARVKLLLCSAIAGGGGLPFHARGEEVAREEEKEKEEEEDEPPYSTPRSCPKKPRRAGLGVAQNSHLDGSMVLMLLL